MSLQRDDWIEAAFRGLSTSGVAAIRVEALARDLGVSKGSFYWHFKDRPALLDAVLGAWERRTDDVIAAVALEPTPRDRLTRFIQLITAAALDPAAAAIETAIFAWGHQDPTVASRVTAIEQRRINHAQLLLEALGFPPAEVTWWAEVGYTVYTGMLSRAARDPEFAQRSRADYLDRLLQAAELLVAAE